MRRLLIPFILLTTLPFASAHRTDEYLQATRLSIDLERVDLEIDLTTGVAMASEVFSWIDTNRDRQISRGEGQAYAQEVIHSLALSVDGKPLPIRFVDISFPQFREMSLGIGAIRLRATATAPAVDSGHHQVSFLNLHRPRSSVYLVNALVPANPRIQLADQRRDFGQHGLTLDYTVAGDGPSAGRLALLAGMALAGCWFLARQRHLDHSRVARCEAGSPK